MNWMVEDSGGVSDLRGVRIYEEDWTGWTGWSRYMNSDLRGVQIYEDEWAGWTGWTGLSKI